MGPESCLSRGSGAGVPHFEESEVELSLHSSLCSATPEPSERKDHLKLGKLTETDLSCVPRLRFTSVSAALRGQDRRWKRETGVSGWGEGQPSTGLGCDEPTPSQVRALSGAEVSLPHGYDHSCINIAGV